MVLRCTGGALTVHAFQGSHVKASAMPMLACQCCGNMMLMTPETLWCLTPKSLCVQAADRPIYYPAKLPPTEAALMEALLQKLQALQQMLDEHMVRAVKQLRTQVMHPHTGQQLCGTAAHGHHYGLHRSTLDWLQAVGSTMDSIAVRQQMIKLLALPDNADACGCRSSLPIGCWRQCLRLCSHSW